MCRGGGGGGGGSVNVLLILRAFAEVCKKVEDKSKMVSNRA